MTWLRADQLEAGMKLSCTNLEITRCSHRNGFVLVSFNGGADVYYFPEQTFDVGGVP